MVCIVYSSVYFFVHCSVLCTAVFIVHCCVYYTSLHCCVPLTSVHCMYQVFCVQEVFYWLSSCPVNNSYSAAMTLLYFIIVYVRTHIKLLIVGIIQAIHIPQVKATRFNQVLNIFYYPYTDKASDTNLCLLWAGSCGTTKPSTHNLIKCL